jgi:hypothetical protein
MTVKRNLGNIKLLNATLQAKSGGKEGTNQAFLIWLYWLYWTINYDISNKDN